ncbi:MAG: SDR family oxidoreductase [Aquihabitans sp.]
MTGKVVLVTGANAGIGRETSLALARMGATVVMAARNPAKGADAVAYVNHRSDSGRAVPGRLDLASFASIRSFAAWFLDEFDRLDVLINNAGLIVDSRSETEDGFEEMFGVNHLGHFLLTDLLRDRLVASAPSRVVVVSSLAHRVAVRGLHRHDLQAERRFHGFSTYARSKLANLLFARELARQLDGTGVTVNAVHPGSVNSHFGGEGDSGLIGPLISTFGRYLLISPTKGARASVLMASSSAPRIATATGGYFPKGHRRPPSRRARNVAAGEWLWAESRRLVESVS